MVTPQRVSALSTSKIVFRDGALLTIIQSEVLAVIFTGVIDWADGTLILGPRVLIGSPNVVYALGDAPNLSTTPSPRLTSESPILFAERVIVQPCFAALYCRVLDFSRRDDDQKDASSSILSTLHRASATKRANCC